MPHAGLILVVFTACLFGLAHSNECPRLRRPLTKEAEDELKSLNSEDALAKSRARGSQIGRRSSGHTPPPDRKEGVGKMLKWGVGFLYSQVKGVTLETLHEVYDGSDIRHMWYPYGDVVLLCPSAEGCEQKVKDSLQKHKLTLLLIYNGATPEHHAVHHAALANLTGSGLHVYDFDPNGVYNRTFQDVLDVPAEDFNTAYVYKVTLQLRHVSLLLSDPSFQHKRLLRALNNPHRYRWKDSDYDLDHNNCEHFVFWVLTSYRCSPGSWAEDTSIRYLARSKGVKDE